MLLNKSKGGDNKEKQNGKGAHKRLFINLVVLFVAWLASAILFSAKVSAQGLTLINDEGKAVEQSVLKSTHLDVQVRGMLAFVELEQVYQNPSLTMLNGRYQFPLPENSAVFHMEMRLDNRLILGEIKEKQQAKVIYQEAQRQGHKAALVNNDSGNVFQTKVANIEPGQEVAVKLKFQFNLGYNNESFSLRIPTVVNSRYYNQTPENPLQQIELDQAEWVPAQNFLPGNVATSYSVKNKITTNIEVDLGFELDTVTSQTHQLSVVQTDTTRYQVILANYNLFANRDIEIKFNPLMKEQVMRQVFVEKVGDEYFYQVMLLPPKVEFIQHSLPRELVFVIDTSGSMAGTSMVQAKEALNLALDNLATDDQFNIIAFDHELRVFKQESVTATYSQLQAAKRFIAGLEADGGTEINQAIRASFNGQYDATRVRQVILITDGAVENVDSVKTLVKNRRADSKLFTVGIGSAPNSHLMKLLAKVGKGDALFINNLETIAEEVSALSNKLANPALQNVKVLNDLGLPIDSALPVADLYFSAPLSAYFKLNQTDKAVQLVADGPHGKYLSRVSLENAISGKGIARAYVKEQLNMLDMVKEKQQITALALQHSLLTPYTAFVAVEEYFGDVADKSIEAPNMQPHGSVMPQSFGHNDTLFLLGLLLLILGFLIAYWGQKHEQ